VNRDKSTKRRFNHRFGWHRCPATSLGRADELIE